MIMILIRIFVLMIVSRLILNHLELVICHNGIQYWIFKSRLPITHKKHIDFKTDTRKRRGNWYRSVKVIFNIPISWPDLFHQSTPQIWGIRLLNSIPIQLIFLFCSTYVTSSAFHEVIITQDLLWIGIYGIGLIGSIGIFLGVILSAMDFKHDNNDGNGGRKKIYPDDKDYSEKVLELMR